jgi:hypothetical protein
MVPSAAADHRLHQWLGRALLCSLAVLNSLQAYPVAGSQLTLATALIVSVAAVCLGDGLAGIAALLRGGAAEVPWRLAAGPLLAIGVLMAQWNLTGAMRAKFAALTPLDLPGARRLRMSEPQVALYRWLVANLRGGDTFVAMPAINSLYIWSELEPPTRMNPNAWMLLLDDAQQQRVCDALASYSRAAAVVVPRDVSRMYGEAQPGQPLARCIADEFRAAGSFLGYELKVRRGRDAPELTYAAREQPAATGWRARLLMPRGAQARGFARLAIVEVRTGRIVAETRPSNQRPQLVVADEAPGTMVLTAAQWPAAVGDALLVRLFDDQDRIIASVPVVR